MSGNNPNQPNQPNNNNNNNPPARQNRRKRAHQSRFLDTQATVQGAQINRHQFQERDREVKKKSNQVLKKIADMARIAAINDKEEEVVETNNMAALIEQAFFCFEKPTSEDFQNLINDEGYALQVINNHQYQQQQEQQEQPPPYQPQYQQQQQQQDNNNANIVDVQTAVYNRVMADIRQEFVMRMNGNGNGNGGPSSTS